MKYLYILQQALIWIVTIFWLYQIAVSFCSLIKLKEKKLTKNKNHKFMAIIPAHNEEMVIKNLVQSLREQDYPKELYDIYVIADNCTDATAEIAKENGCTICGSGYQDVFWGNLISVIGGATHKIIKIKAFPCVDLVSAYILLCLT